jgi:hypothetical protein
MLRCASVHAGIVSLSFTGPGHRINDGVPPGSGHRGLRVDCSKRDFFLDFITRGPVIAMEIQFQSWKKPSAAASTILPVTRQ